MSTNVFAKTVRGFTSALERTLVSEITAHESGLLQSLDPRVKLVGLLALVVAAALSRKLAVTAALFALGVVLALASRIALWSLAKRVWVVVFAFTFMIAAPALFLTPGQVLYSLPFGGLTLTSQGLRSTVLLIARVETAVTLSTLLVLTTPWMHLLKALRTLMVPVEIIALLAMTHRYAVLLMETANSMFESRQSRLVGRLNGHEHRHLMVNTGGVLLSKTLDLGNQVFLSMQARGFRGEVYLLNDFRLRGWDYVAMSGFAVAATAAVLAGR
ncbi:MAG: cobalt ECF transporter T component CbiQ [Acidobacteria bacterium]|nr:MAG: cobalt ECF transporter T component CbiQ [Acidobacteriota bacterium]